ncbi:hypothetical protein LV89_02611 [Arcicella aurantiaca]|uniref:Uncharacterized protein n=1 Tax=Arcicella aurantiaca TaxID=591202 RepID=A0A316E6U6_9BACT|nr:hypothetical protein [Arcicella aurantiaca]PWK26131.1 hypothetical protein LV89_02611 [Arcicella aurantiaca]
MDKFIRNNFLAICITLAVIFAFAQKATIFQQDAPKTVQPVVKNTNQEIEATFNNYWKEQGTETSLFILKQDSVKIAEAMLSFTLQDFEQTEPKEHIQMLASTFTQKSINYKNSVTTSTLMPLNILLRPHALEVSSSVQELNGTGFMKLTFAPKSYAVTIEGNLIKKDGEHLALSKTHNEDEMWSKIRQNPATLPQGEFEIIPSLTYWNSLHKTPEVQSVKAEFKNYDGKEFTGKKLKIYSLNYPDLKRNLSIIFEENSPFKIVGWTEENEGKVVIGRRY